MENFLDDPHGLLDMANDETSIRLTSPLTSRFSEICEFTERTGEPPRLDAQSLREQQLAQWLVSILGRPELIKLLIDGGWESQVSEFQSSIQFEQRKTARLQDPFGLLRMARGTGVQQIRNVSRVKRQPPELIARRKPCADFSKFAPKFEEIAQAIEAGRVNPSSAVTGNIRPGVFLVVNDLLGYVESVEAEITERKFKSGERRRQDGRTRVIFENATESEMLLRSLEKAVLSDGYLLKQPDPEMAELDQVAGFLYVVKSKRDLSGQNREVFKIGYTRTSVERRLAKARTEAAYLFGEVEVVASYRCLGVDPAALESALHAFFATGKLEIELDLGLGNILKPKEWFGVDFQDIDRAVFLALESELGNYSYFPSKGIVPRSSL
jgi:hypothetical protein